MKKATVTLPRDKYEDILAALREIAKLEPAEGESYAGALGRANGIAIGAAINLEVYGK